MATRGAVKAVRGFISDVFGDVSDELKRHYKDVTGINAKTGKPLSKQDEANRDMVRAAAMKNPLSREKVRNAAPALLGTGAVGGAAITKVYDALPDNPTPAQLTGALRKHLKENKVPAAVSRKVLSNAKEKAESLLKDREETKQKVNRSRALKDVRKAEEKRNVPPMPPKRPANMNKGGYNKKSRKGSMDYRKGGLFTKK